LRARATGDRIDIVNATHDAPGEDAYRSSAKRALPLLDNLRVAAPCDVAWDDMVGNGRVRHCDSCQNQVFNISAMSRADAEVLLRERSENVCVRFYRRFDGTIMTRDCSVGVRLRYGTRAVMAVLTTVVLGALALLGLGRTVKTEVIPSATMGMGCVGPGNASEK
jgi:hypothetical protein